MNRLTVSHDISAHVQSDKKETCMESHHHDYPFSKKLIVKYMLQKYMSLANIQLDIRTVSLHLKHVSEYFQIYSKISYLCI